MPDTIRLTVATPGDYVLKAFSVSMKDGQGEVANDTVRNFFFHNQPGPGGTRVYVEKAYPIGAAYADEGKPRGGMGIDWCEFVAGRPAAVIANFANEPLTFLTRDRPNRLIFADAAQSVGLAGPSRGPLKFGVLFLDYDNDGRPDLIVNNGHIEPAIETIQASQRHAQPPLLFWNTGDPECYFEQAKEAAAGPDLFAPLVGRGCIAADLDGDGDLDLVLVANGGPARVLRNDAPATNRALRLDLRGNGTTSNRSAIGAVVTVEAGGKTIVAVSHATTPRGRVSIVDVTNPAINLIILHDLDPNADDPGVVFSKFNYGGALKNGYIHGISLVLRPADL